MSEFTSELLLAEYRAMREEITKKMDHRTSMVVCSVTVSSAVLGFGIERQSAPLLLVSPIVSLLLGILVMFTNVQIGIASEYLRTRIERPVLSRFNDPVGWHQSMVAKIRWAQQILPYYLPLTLIAVTPAIVAIPLTLSNFGPVTSTAPVLAVVCLLLILYIFQFVQRQKLIGQV